MQKTILILSGLAAVLPPLLITIGLMAPGIAAIKVALLALVAPIGLVTKLFTGLFTLMAANPFTALA